MNSGPPVDTVVLALGGGACHRGGPRAPGTGAARRGGLRAGAGRAGVGVILAPRRRAGTTASSDTIAEGVAGRVPIPAVLDDLLLVADDVVLVREESTVAGMRLLLDHAALVVEPSVGLGVAAITGDRDRFAGRSVATVVCGGNVDMAVHRYWTGGAQAREH
ncbi:pyridoxal-phosphate dependent enzyme [Streptomyces albidoflavus]|uniref:pyridoxal-phosphate dependent enzyme n=1 Tax=Streptomyces albidoflavus TaxID=1886 RepID=UPI0034536408